MSSRSKRQECTASSRRFDASKNTRSGSIPQLHQHTARDPGSSNPRIVPIELCRICLRSSAMKPGQPWLSHLHRWTGHDTDMHAALVGAGMRDEVLVPPDTLTKLTTGQSKQCDSQEILHIEKLRC